MKLLGGAKYSLNHEMFYVQKIFLSHAFTQSDFKIVLLKSCLSLSFRHLFSGSALLGLNELSGNWVLVAILQGSHERLKVQYFQALRKAHAIQEKMKKQMWAFKRSNKCLCPRHNLILNSTLHLGRTSEVLHEVHDKATAIF